MSTEKLSDQRVQEARAKVTGLSKGYSDLNLKFKAHPTLGDIRPVKDLDAIKNSIRNILLTRRGERPFNPAFGSNLKQYLFEPADPITKASMEQEIRYSIGEQEPRVEIKNVDIQDDSDRNAYYITITVILINRQETADVQIYLERLR
jgi:phage baseplate assembly protein W